MEGSSPGDEDEIRYEICEPGSRILEENPGQIVGPFRATKQLGKGQGSACPSSAES